jgi:leucyl-tRNA synthetase
MDQWVNGVTEPRWTSERIIEAGATFESSYTYGGNVHDITYEVTGLEAPTKMATRSTSGPFPFDSEIVLVSIEDKTRVTNTLDARATNSAMRVWFALGGILIRLFMRRQLERELMLVKTLMENADQPE